MADIAELQYAEEQGILLGQRQMLIRQMTRHIGLLPAHIEARIHILSSHQITELGEALFDLNSYVEVDEWLSRL